jgi:signal peptidase I
MAPTLMGQHFLWRSDQTGYQYPVDMKQVQEDRLNSRANRSYNIADPMIGPGFTLARPTSIELPKTRMGDRILVIKCLYPFRQPDRFDVVVFKNPTDPDGEAENYIKRLVGLPDESIWLLDGDVFVAPAAASDDLHTYEVQRKPEHVQRAVWQPVHDSDFIPIRPLRLEEQQGKPYLPAWSGDGWQIAEDRDYRCETAEPTVLTFDTDAHPINDRTTYNMLTPMPALRPSYLVSDVRLSAGIVAEQPGLETTVELETRGHVFACTIADGQATLSIRPLEPDGDGTRMELVSEIDSPKPGKVYRIEFWHVDQALWLFVNGKRVGEPLTYEWRPLERLPNSYGLDLEAWQRVFVTRQPTQPALRWRFNGSPVTLHRVQVDRDLYYRPGKIPRAQKNPPYVSGDAFGTSPKHFAVLGPDQFFMLGDNSPASSDSRVWGSPHPLVAHQIDESPFVVNKKLLLGKAWVVYFPAPYALRGQGRGLIPDFGRLRFIR